MMLHSLPATGQHAKLAPSPASFSLQGSSVSGKSVAVSQCRLKQGSRSARRRAKKSALAVASYSNGFGAVGAAHSGKTIGLGWQQRRLLLRCGKM